jgi:predicted RND superfamily exporter protein
MGRQVLDLITDIQTEHAFKVLALFLLLTLAMIPGMNRVETIVALENMMPADSEPVEEFNNLRDIGIGKDTVVIVVRTDQSEEGVKSVDSSKAEKYVKYLANSTKEIYGITEVQSPYTGSGLINDDRDTAIIVAYTYMGDDGEQMDRIFAEINEQKSYERPEGVETSISGVPAVQRRLSEMVARDKNVTTAIALGLVFLITLGLFRGSLTSALMPLTVVGFSIIWLYGTMGYLGIPLSTLAGAVAALVIGIGIDYSIHILNDYRYERKNNSVADSVRTAVNQTGVAILATSVTTISAFMAFLVGKMPEMHRFGLIMSIGIGYSLIFSFLLLPSVFVIEDRITEKIYKSMDWRFSENAA